MVHLPDTSLGTHYGTINVLFFNVNFFKFFALAVLIDTTQLSNLTFRVSTMCQSWPGHILACQVTLETKRFHEGWIWNYLWRYGLTRGPKDIFVFFNPQIIFVISNVHLDMTYQVTFVTCPLRWIKLGSVQLRIEYFSDSVNQLCIITLADRNFYLEFLWLCWCT